MVTHDEQPQSRRRFLQRLSVLGAASLGGSALLAACGGGETEAPTDAPATADTDAGTMSDADFSCMDTAGLTEQEVQMRQNLSYVDQSPNPDQLCNNCEFYQEEGPDGPCGGCTLLKGPIHPEGYCTSWVASTTA